MIGETLRPHEDGQTDELSEPDAGSTSGFSSRRVAAAVVPTVTILALAVAGYSNATLHPQEPYGDGTITVGGQSYEAAVCESVETGVELHYGSEDVVYVRHMGPSEIYEELAVKPERMDGTFIVRATEDGEVWSQQATMVETERREFVFEASFDAGAAITVAYTDGGWCRGSDPNVWWR